MATKRVLLLGSGFVAGPCLDYLLRRPENFITVACRHEDAAVALCKGRSNTAAIALDVKDPAALLDQVSKHDVVISLVPYTLHPLIIEAAVTAKKHFVSTSYVSPKMLEFNQRAIDANVTVLNEIGVDPGIDHLYAMKTIEEAHARGDKIISFTSYCGGLPAPEFSNNPLGYKFSWSARGVLLAATNNAKFIENGQVVEIAGKDLLSVGPREIRIYPGFAFEGYPNRDSTPYTTRYDIPEAKTVLRGTLRYKGNPAFIKALNDIGLLNDDQKEYLSETSKSKSWLEILAIHFGVPVNVQAVRDAVISAANLHGRSDASHVLSGISWLGLFSTEEVALKGTLLETLANTMVNKMKYLDGERDMIMLQHRFEIEKQNGDKETRTSTLLEFGIPNGDTAMSRTVGIPCAIATQLILDGIITQRGVLAPLSRDLYEPIIKLLEHEGIGCKEEILDSN